MGLLSELLLIPLAPARVAMWSIDNVVAAAERQYHDPAVIRRELAQLADQLDVGVISEEEFDRREDELLDRLAEGGGA